MPLANTSMSPAESPLGPRSRVVSPTGRSTTLICSAASADAAGNARSAAASAAIRRTEIFMFSPLICRAWLLSDLPFSPAFLAIIPTCTSRPLLFKTRCDHLDQRRSAVTQGGAYGVGERGGIVDPIALGAIRVSDADTIGIAADDAELRNARGHHVVADLAQRRVVPHHDGQAQSCFDGGHELGQGELNSEIARERDDGTGGARDLGAQCGRQREPQGAIAGLMEPLPGGVDRVGAVSQIR